ncbi:DNA-directed RNA polymerases II [Phytophthora nicotianae]|uniref:DNA-directed RNA polymerases II n=1 Tax=Phytophthora nicotianae TaxID=4792 RepID=A0A0W8BNE7_PHYNI|nr:DNA-directed RNA polymerases II [Phytophthora nicotianae]
MPHPRFPKIDVQELRDDFIRFELSETDASVANAIRRVMISEVPTLAIDLVSIEINTSVMTDEFLAHRLGMIPLNFDGGLENFRQRFVYSQDCDCDENCPNCSVEFTLDVIADSGVLSVTSEALKSSDPYIRPVNFSSEEELNNTQDTGVIIAKLGPGQRLRLSAIAKLGIGKEHAKWSPVAVATYMYDPIITLNQAVLSTYSPEQKAELYKSCPTEVYETDENYEQVRMKNWMLEERGDAMRCMYCDECVKLADSFKDNPEDDSAVTIRMREDKFIFSVETTGQLKPEEVVICALDLIREKLSSLKHQCLELSQDDQGSSAPITPFG